MLQIPGCQPDSLKVSLVKKLTKYMKLYHSVFILDTTSVGTISYQSKMLCSPTTKVDIAVSLMCDSST